MNNEYEIVCTKPTLEDWLVIKKIHTDAIIAQGNKYYTPQILRAWIDNFTKDSFNAKVNNQDFIYVLAKNNTTIIGFGVLNKATMNIEALYVAPAYIGKSLGKQLLFALENQAVSLNATVISLTSSLNAVNFYKHFGFKELQNIYKVLVNGISINCLAMSKELFI